MSWGRRGGAAVEFAISFAFLFAVFAGVFQFGYALYQYNALESAVRGGARYASVRVYDSATETPSASFTAAVGNMVVYGNPAGGTRPAAPGLAPGDIEVAASFERNVPARVTVAVRAYSLDALFTTFRLQGKPKAVFPYMGRYAP